MYEQLIEAVRSKPIIYDTNNSSYMNPKLKFETWNAIAKDLNLKGGFTAKNTWLKLRNCHRDALRRQRNCLKNGTPLVAIKQWKFQKQMEFLIPYMTKRPREATVDDYSDDEESQEQSENTEIEKLETQIMKYENAESENLDNEIVETVNSDNNEDNLDNTEEFVKRTGTPSISYAPTSVPKNKRIKKYDTGSILRQTVPRREQRVIESTKLEQAKQPNDHLYHFFMSMYEISKNMPPASQHLVRNNVFQAVSQVEANLLNISDVRHIHQQHPHCYTQHSQPQCNQSRQLRYSNSSMPTARIPHSSYSSTGTPITSPLTCYDDTRDETSPTPSTDE